MGWEQRNGRYYYYYRKERSGGRVRSVYVGRGEIAEMAATLDGIPRDNHETESIEEQNELEALNLLDESIDALARLASTLTQAVLITAGFHQHKRQWRKRKA